VLGIKLLILSRVLAMQPVACRIDGLHRGFAFDLREAR
jgi:hypothetical protein